MATQFLTGSVWDGSEWKPTMAPPLYLRPYLDVVQVIVSTGSEPHVKGAWTEIIASTSGYSDLLAFAGVFFQASTNTSTLLDVGIGPSGSEVPLIENLAVGGRTGNINGAVVAPVRIAVGERVSVRLQGRIAERSSLVTAVLQRFNWLASETIDVFGALIETSQGSLIQVSPNFTQMVETEKDYLWVTPVFSLSTTSAATTSSFYIIRIVPPSGPTLEFERDLSTSTSEIVSQELGPRGVSLPSLGELFGPVPAGSQILLQSGISNVRGTLICGVAP